MEIERRDKFAAQVKPLHLDDITVFRYVKFEHRITHINKIRLMTLLSFIHDSEWKSKITDFATKNPDSSLIPLIIKNLNVKHKDGKNILLRISANGNVYWSWESNSKIRPTIPVGIVVYSELILEGDFENEDLILNYEIGFLPQELENAGILHIIPIKSDATDGSLLTSMGGAIGKVSPPHRDGLSEREMEYPLVELSREIRWEMDDTLGYRAAVKEARRLLEKDLANYNLLTS